MFCSNASWKDNAVTVADRTIIGSAPLDIFINQQDQLFIINQDTGDTLIWKNLSGNPVKIDSNATDPWSMFVTEENEIFIENRCPKNRIESWNLNGTRMRLISSVSSSCAGLFVDINNDVYCSQYYKHIVAKKSLNDPNNRTTTVAGTGCRNSAADALDTPNGIFVDKNLDLYVADSGNNRIQRFSYGRTVGVTVAGNGVGSFNLLFPITVTLDGHGYLFIVDRGNHRIIGSGSGGFRCLVGCSGINGSSSSQLNGPTGLSFDSHGNMFVSDTFNHRIQQFSISPGSLCSELTIHKNP